MELGRFVPFKETPSRLDAILQALKELDGYPIVPPVDHGMGPVSEVHTDEYVAYLKMAYNEWVDRGGNPDGIFPDAFAVRDFVRQKNTKANSLYPIDGGRAGRPGY
ncbi:hypothetical protein HDV05_000636, partial [Chytridiales sp. JEL 0842]